uniref:Amine oxidase n=1 Tax=Ditylum brightwellii TaxID=49249 RepID=A0A7S1ZN27_9STRA|mmetsp:Transcript_35432/g.52882  ORF Transcript_35432/g.52882 Transcript_35432/m.52882 type:complete len:597 (+) Transcript_35432:64-1854(+)
MLWRYIHLLFMKTTSKSKRRRGVTTLISCITALTSAILFSLPSCRATAFVMSAFVNKHRSSHLGLFRQRPQHDSSLAVGTSFPYNSRCRHQISQNFQDEVDVCIIGGGVSGLTAAKHAAAAAPSSKNSKTKILLLESSPTFGGRVQTDKTADGYYLDRGFAVFIDAYPQCQIANLNKDTLHLGAFEPGALVVLDEGGEGKNSKAKIARVADPIRRPKRLLQALTSPVGTFRDKLRLFPLLYYIRTRSVEELFDNINNKGEEDTKTCLKQQYGFSDSFINEFFAPFFEGIFFCPLEEQSSNMFHFVFKMFNVGSATLPKGGIGSVTTKLVEDAKNTATAVDCELEFRVNSTTTKITVVTNKEKKGDESNHFLLDLKDEAKSIRAKSVIIATEESTAQKILSCSIDDFKLLYDEEEKGSSTRSVGAIYYGFESALPVSEPILIINGMRDSDSGSSSCRHPINSVCFPSAVVDGYAPEGCHLCCVSIPGDVMEQYRDKYDALDQIVRTKLSLWFPDHAQDIQNEWDCKGAYYVENAQPLQRGVPYPATFNGGRDCNTFRGQPLPEGLYICGDHVATATLNGALESGVNAGKEAVKFIQK